jgi:hypothetical protein
MCSQDEKGKDGTATPEGVQPELPYPVHGTAYPEGVQWDLTKEFNEKLNQCLQQMEKPATTETPEDGPRWVWECAGCQKQAVRITDLLVRRMVNVKLTPK